MSISDIISDVISDKGCHVQGSKLVGFLCINEIHFIFGYFSLERKHHKVVKNLFIWPLHGLVINHTTHKLYMVQNQIKNGRAHFARVGTRICLLSMTVVERFKHRYLDLSNKLQQAIYQLVSSAKTSIIWNTSTIIDTSMTIQYESRINCQHIYRSTS